MLAAGTPRGLVHAGLLAGETLRLAQALPRFGPEAAPTAPAAECARGQPRLPGPGGHCRDGGGAAGTADHRFPHRRAAARPLRARADPPRRPAGYVTSGAYVPALGAAVLLARIERAAEAERCVLL